MPAALADGDAGMESNHRSSRWAESLRLSHTLPGSDVPAGTCKAGEHLPASEAADYAVTIHSLKAKRRRGLSEAAPTAQGSQEPSASNHGLCKKMV